MLVPYLKHTHIYEYPSDKENFFISLVLDIAIPGVDGADQFYCSVISPSALAEELEERTIMPGRGLLLVNEFNLDIITRKITEILNSAGGETWEEIAMSINKYFPWEYDGFTIDRS